jgi:hypothetical protein
MPGEPSVPVIPAIDGLELTAQVGQHVQDGCTKLHLSRTGIAVAVNGPVASPVVSSPVVSSPVVSSPVVSSPVVGGPVVASPVVASPVVGGAVSRGSHRLPAARAGSEAAAAPGRGQCLRSATPPILPPRQVR